MPNPLEKYYAKIEDLTDFNPETIKEAGEEVMKAVKDDNRNDPTAWMAYAGTAMKQAWMSLPKEYRTQMINAMNDLIQQALAGVDEVKGALQQVSDAISTIPIIGWIIDAVLQVVVDIAKVVQITKRNREMSRARWKRQRMVSTLDDIDDPRDWVFVSAKVRNYSHYVKVRGGGDWSLTPSFRRSGSTLMFSADPGPADKGKCGKTTGVEMSCDARSYSDIACRKKPKKQSDSDICVRYLGISALFYPYWSPAYSVGPIEVPINENESVQTVLDDGGDPNSILMARQVMLLTDPYANLRVRGERLREMTDRFVGTWQNQMKAFGVGGKMGLLKIDEDGNAPGTPREDRMLIDERKDPKWSGAKSLRNRFYFDEDGRIVPYDGTDVNDWGIRTWGGGGTLACSVGAYNAVVTNTMAFFTARSNMIRNGFRMKGLLMDHSIRRLDPEVRDAVKYAANKDEMLPGPTGPMIVVKGVKVIPPGVKRLPPKVPSRYDPKIFKAAAAIPTDEKKKSALPILLLGGGLVAIMAMRGKGRRR